MNLKPPLPEALDKLVILTLKLQRLKDNPNRYAVEREHTFYANVLEQYHREGFYIKPYWVAVLTEINGRIWDMEASLREGRDKELGLEEIGRRALKIRDTNRERVEYKNKIAEDIGMDFFEVKGDHSSVNALDNKKIGAILQNRPHRQEREKKRDERESVGNDESRPSDYSGWRDPNSSENQPPVAERPRNQSGDLSF